MIHKIQLGLYSFFLVIKLLSPSYVIRRGAKPVEGEMTGEISNGV